MDAAGNREHRQFPPGEGQPAKEVSDVIRTAAESTGN